MLINLFVSDHNFWTRNPRILIKGSKDLDSSLVSYENFNKILSSSSWALGHVTWAKMTQKLLHLWRLSFWKTILSKLCQHKIFVYKNKWKPHLALSRKDSAVCGNWPGHCGDEVCTMPVKPASTPHTLQIHARPTCAVFAPHLLFCVWKLEIGLYLGFTDISVLAKTANFIGLSRCWQNAVIFLTHPNNLRKKHNEASQHLSYSNTSRCGFINKQTRLTMKHAWAIAAETKASSVSFAMLDVVQTALPRVDAVHE